MILKRIIQLLKPTFEPSKLKFKMSAEKAQKLNIISLEAFIEDKRVNDPLTKFMSKSSTVMQYGIHPLLFRHQLMVYLKYSFWTSSLYGEKKLLDFIKTMELRYAQIKTILAIDHENESALSELKMIRNYQLQLSRTLFPVSIYKMELCSKYLQHLIEYLHSVDSMDPVTTKIVLNNLLRITFPQQQEWEFVSQRTYGLILYQALNLYLDKLGDSLPQLQSYDKQSIIALGKSLRSNHLGLLEFVKKEVQKKKKTINLVYFLIGLNLLAINKCFPFEYFYSQKSSIMFLIQSTYNLSDKKVQNSIFMLQIFARQRLMYCEKIIDRLLIVLEDNLLAMDEKQLIKMFFFYSKLKSSIKLDFVVKTVQRIYLFMDQLDDRDYGMLIKALARLNYQNQALIKKLKAWNYQLFLGNLKYDCSKLGSFYQKILEEVQNAFNNSYKESDNYDEDTLQQGKGRQNISI